MYTPICCVHAHLSCTHPSVMYTPICRVHAYLSCAHPSVVYTPICGKHATVYVYIGSSRTLRGKWWRYTSVCSDCHSSRRTLSSHTTHPLLPQSMRVLHSHADLQLGFITYYHAVWLHETSGLTECVCVFLYAVLVPFSVQSLPMAKAMLPVTHSTRHFLA